MDDEMLGHALMNTMASESDLTNEMMEMILSGSSPVSSIMSTGACVLATSAQLC